MQLYNEYVTFYSQKVPKKPISGGSAIMIRCVIVYLLPGYHKNTGISPETPNFFVEKADF